jgi:hypothetical protein
MHRPPATGAAYGLPGGIYTNGAKEFFYACGERIGSGRTMGGKSKRSWGSRCDAVRRWMGVATGRGLIAEE